MPHYDTGLMAEFDKIVEGMTVSSPDGRISILNGPPGTGKSWFARGIISASPEAMHIVVTPKTAPALADPEFIPTMLRIRNHDQPVVITIEDADRLLKKRRSETADAVSALLNMGDGIFGESMDIRILATTNLDVSELDEATSREGRLSLATFGGLEKDQANDIVRRLIGKEPATLFANRATLAQAYKVARGLGWKPATKPAVVEDDE